MFRPSRQANFSPNWLISLIFPPKFDNKVSQKFRGYNFLIANFQTFFLNRKRDIRLQPALKFYLFFYVPLMRFLLQD